MCSTVLVFNYTKPILGHYIVVDTAMTSLAREISMRTVGDHEEAISIFQPIAALFALEASSCEIVVRLAVLPQDYALATYHGVANITFLTGTELVELSTSSWDLDTSTVGR